MSCLQYFEHHMICACISPSLSNPYLFLSSWTTYIVIINIQMINAVVSFSFVADTFPLNLLFSCMLLYTLLLLFLFIVHPHRYKHHTEEPPSFFSNQLDVSLVNRQHRVLPSLRCLASISRTPMSSVRYTIVSLILTSRQHQHARSYISSTPSSF